MRGWVFGFGDKADIIEPEIRCIMASHPDFVAYVCEQIDGEEEPPYEGAKPHFVIERLDDREWLAQFMQATCSKLKEPAPEKKKNIY